MNNTNILIIALLGGIIPAMFWLWFWIREDRLRPEPKSALFSAFSAGVIAVFLAFFFELVFYYLFIDSNSNTIENFPFALQHFLEKIVTSYNLSDWQFDFWGKIQDSLNISSSAILNAVDIKKGALVVFIAPIIEETLKFILAYNICLRRKVNDEPIDASIYMLTCALGFAAIETALFMTEPLSNGELLNGLVAGNFRSIGPMLIHLVSSTILGIFIGLAFYKGTFKKFLYTALGLFIAIVLHSIFNLFITLNDTTHNAVFFWLACLGTWLMVVVLLVFFERVKKVSNYKFKLTTRKNKPDYGIISPYNIS